jgi:LysM repeat protein
MKKRYASLTLIMGLALVLIVVAGCNRPDSTVELPTPTPGEAQAVQPTLSPVATPTPTLPPSSGEPDLNATMAAEAGLTPSALQPALTDTPIPAAQPTAAAPAPATSTPSAPAEAAAPATPAPGGQVIYTVQLGDRLFSIARIYNVNPYAIATANNIQPPYLIYPGQKLTIPSGTPVTPVPGQTPAPKPGCRSTFVVKPGDNLFRISLATGVSQTQIAAANGITNFSLIYVGQKLCIP